MFDSRNGLWRRTGAIGRSRALRAIGRCLDHQLVTTAPGRQERKPGCQTGSVRGEKVDCRAQTRRATPSAGKRSATRSRKAASKSETSSTGSFYAVDPYALAFTNDWRPWKPPLTRIASNGGNGSGRGRSHRKRHRRLAGGHRTSRSVEFPPRHSSVRARPCRFPHKCG